jgi:hypothetical protein
VNARRSIIRMLRIAGLVSSFGIVNGLGGQQPRTFDSDTSGRPGPFLFFLDPISSFKRTCRLVEWIQP